MKNNLKQALTQVPVLLIFFTRPDTFRKVFERVKEARPAKLFLACDGPRLNHPEDLKLINECQIIAENIDWECEVFQNYAEENMGCGMRPQSAISWAFEKVDRLVVLEDDCVPHRSFFPFMEEMLERYKNDERIGLVCGFNHFLNWECGEYSYFFTKVGPMAGAWGTWRRIWKMYDYTIKNIEDPLIQRLIYDDITFSRAKKKKLELFKKTAYKIKNNENITYWDVQFSYLKSTQSLLSIVPKVSLASNIGLGVGSTHAQNAKNSMPSIFFTEEKVLSFPLAHPPFVICDHRYDNKVDATWGFPNPFIRNLKRGLRLLHRIFDK